LRSNIENERIYEVAASKYMEGDKVHVLGIDVSRGKSSCALLHDHTVVKKFQIESGLAKLRSIITSDVPAHGSI
jgi:putative protein kinase ArgK-like GTPase of G3E family